MTDAPELLTDEDIHALGQLNTHGERVAFLRERGLIAPEPEPKLTPEESLEQIERGIGKLYDQHRCWPGTFDIMGVIRPIFRKAIETATESAPAASPLTVERLREAVIASRPQMLEDTDFEMREGEPCRQEAEGFVNRLHAAILKQMKRRP